MERKIAIGLVKFVWRFFAFFGEPLFAKRGSPNLSPKTFNQSLRRFAFLNGAVIDFFSVI
jgi:hypothetical protein